MQYIDMQKQKIDTWKTIRNTKLPVSGFEWVEDILVINEKLIKIIKNCDQESDSGCIFEVNIE